MPDNASHRGQLARQVSMSLLPGQILALDFPGGIQGRGDASGFPSGGGAPACLAASQGDRKGEAEAEA